MKRRSIADRIFRALIRLLPGDFRGDFGDQMRADFDERRSTTGGSSALGREAIPLISTAIREHLGILQRDVRDALRLMRRAPAFSTLAVLMLALGTGANVAMFSVIDAVMLRSPFVDPDRIVQLRVQQEDGRRSAIVSLERYKAIAASPRAFAAVAGLGGGSHLLTGSGDPRRVDFECVTASMFDAFGTRPLYGRPLIADDDRPGAVPAIVLGYAFARELGDPARLPGTWVTLNQTPVTVVGVMPPGFAGIFSSNDTSGWLPIFRSVSGGGLSGCAIGRGLNLFARVRADMTVAEAAAAFPGVELVPIHEMTFSDVETPFIILSAAVGCVLLIACLNVGGLQMERTLARRREIALRVALGASRARLVRHAVTENLVLALAGAAAGVVAAALLLGALVSILPTNLPHLDEIAVNGRVLAVAIAAATAAALISALLPVLQTRHVNPAFHLQESGRAATSRNEWTRRGLVIIEIALSIVVLIAAGLMIQTFATLRPAKPGFDPDRKLVTLVRLPGATQDAAEHFYVRLFDRLRMMPGVRGVEASSYLPMSGTVATVAITYDASTANAWAAAVTPGYFDLMKIPVKAGRSFTVSDTGQSMPVAIVNEILASRLSPGGAAVGMRVRAPQVRIPGTQPIEWLIVGVIGNTRSMGSHIRPSPEFYVPYAQNRISVLQTIVETDRWHNPAAVAEIRAAIRELQPDLVIEPVESMTTLLNRRVARPRFGAWLLGIFAALAVALAAIGLMATMGWWVRQRTRELGVRVALGASRAQVTRLIVRQGMLLGVTGIALGCLVAIGVTRFLADWIYGVTPLDTLTFVAAITGMLVVVAIAISAPLRRALRVDPVIALRAE